MRLDEHGQEDVMKEAVSLIKRIECRYASRIEPVVLGFNQQGWLFVYFSSDPMYRFDKQGQLRRAFVDGILFRTTGKTLAMMERHSSRNQTEPRQQSDSYLLRRDLAPDELEAFRRRLRSELEDLCVGLDQGEIVRQYPVEAVGLASEFKFAVKQALDNDSHDFLAPEIVRR